MGGEKPGVCYTQCAKRGSPPHGRGKGSSSTSDTRSPGITPAWAGKSRPVAAAKLLPWDHPRMGGEKLMYAALLKYRRGSPPHGRGKVFCRRGLRFWVRITPAWAGKSRLFICFHFFGEDHPRMGGEKHLLSPILRAALGSPPHGRGKAYRAAGHCTRRGITPAWAGKSSCRFILGKLSRDHPRMGGEKTKKIP